LSVVRTFGTDDRAASYQFHPDQKTELLEDGVLIVSFKAAGHLEMAWHLYSWGDGVEVIKPSGLADVVHPYRRGDFASYP
jgi:predicted DNA-binding transcriptional regulator YafY